MTDHERFRHLAARYALGALTSRERAVFEEHLRTCAECATEVHSFIPVVAAVAESVRRVAPPARVKERLLVAVNPGARPAAGPGRIGARLVWMTAAALCAVALVAYAVQLRARLTSLEAAAQSMQGGTLEKAVVVSDSVRHVELTGQGAAPRAFGCALLSEGRLVITAGDLPPLAPGTSYQVWLISGNTVASAGELVGSGARFRAFAAISSPAAATAVAVTLEQARGDGPTGPRYLAGAF